MHRRSNLQCNQLYRDFSVNHFDVTGPVRCDTTTLPQSMRPFSNRFCGNYDYTKNGIRNGYVNISLRILLTMLHILYKFTCSLSKHLINS